MEEDDTTPVPYARREQALALWRSGEAYLSRLTPTTRETYEEAIGLGLVFLQRYTSMEQLLTAYFTPSPTLEHDWVRFVSHLAAFPLNRGIIEDAAYWRRTKQLIAQHVQEPPHDLA